MKFLVLDIETYGILEGRRQRYFQPIKSEVYDRVPSGRQVVTVSLTWRPSGGTALRSAIFVMNRADHRARLWEWLARAQREGWTLLGQNLTFDLLYLRYNYPEARLFLQPPLRLMDTLITNYLHDEARPERSLKDIAPLLGVTKYSDEGFRQYRDHDDRELWAYNCQDTEATYHTHEKLAAAIQETYGADTAKLGPFCMDWYSQLLWLVLWMTEDGVTIDVPQLRNLHARYEARLAKLTKIADAYGLILSGEDSVKSKRGIMQGALDFIEEWNSLPTVQEPPAPRVEPLTVPVLKLTAKQGKIAFKDENRNALLDVLPHSCLPARHLRLLSRVQDTNGMIDKYTRPLLFGSKIRKNARSGHMGPAVLGSQIYPSWFPVPGEFDDGTRGGTRQSRIVAKVPPVQTFPPLVKSCITCRYPGGYLIWFDYSQIEYRIAALLSGDEVMARYFEEGLDIHTETAKKVFHTETPTYDQRQAAKVVNFLRLYRGGAKKLKEGLLVNAKLNIPIGEAVRMVETDRAAHPTLRAWQDGLMDQAERYGFIELPLVGQSRLFLGGRTSVEENVNDIVNLPVQVMAANVMLDAQFHLYFKIKQAGMRTKVPLNVYDAAPLEVPPLELEPVQAIMKEVLPNPPFYAKLCQHLGRSLPLVYKMEVSRRSL